MAARAKVILFGHRRWTVRFCVGGQLLNLFCASGWQFCPTEVELFVLIESSSSVNFALQFGKAWNRSFVGRDIFVIHLFLLETRVSVCCEKESSTKSIRAFVNQLYKPSGS